MPVGAQPPGQQYIGNQVKPKQIIWSLDHSCRKHSEYVRNDVKSSRVAPNHVITGEIIYNHQNTRKSRNFYMIGDHVESWFPSSQ
jgi:hypothetical protein